MIDSLNTIEISVILFFSQILFLGARSLNVIYTANEDVWKAVFSGLVVAIFWLTSLSLGISSVFKGEYLPVLAWLVGGSVGTYYSFKLKKLLDRIKKKK